MEWKLSELSVDGKGHYGIGAPAIPYDKNKPTYLRITDINDDGTINFLDLKSVDDEDSNKYLLKENDIVFARTGNSTGRSYFYQKEHGDFVYAGFLIKFSIDPQKVNPKILKYYTHSQEYYNWVKSFDTGGTRGNINAKTFGDMPISLPKRCVQDKIVGILSALDAKIENNNKINANLEAQAQALFKSWFVDFTPFKDQPFVNSELGPIPQGWKVVSLDEVCLKITDGSHFSPKDNPKEKIPMLSVKDMRKHGFDYQSCKHITESDFFKLQKNDCVPHVNDLLVAKDGSYLKEIFLCKKEIKQAILSSIAIFRPNTKLILPEYLLHYLKQPQVLKDVRDNYVSGSAVPRIVLKDFKKLKLCIPPMNSISTYRELLKSIEKLLLQKTEENQRLAALRDTLLPKLMSGEIKL